MPEGEYNNFANKTLDFFHERIEEFLEDHDVEGSDVQFAMGVMTVKLGDKGTYVLNKQAPNRQLWLSSPVSGPIRYDYDGSTDSWLCMRDGHKLHELLEKEFVQLCGGKLLLA
eukprot:CAMPEP_0196589138 /NCGR_PEP_ID=MMETSP1081-20130531/62822_1 /TAXON_ID=36882 /ORGANISM="Pyramimonas amylifera, Strain CCMP720" /LENGTH=112 /DNA_ID=CAMNT_0041911861 /DNA_START=377 /DNA_END=715 /DNA_ORIENTATION=+